MNLYDKLISYRDSDYCPMHMPGHKRNPAFSMTDPYQIDITEIDGFDDLSHADGILYDLMKEAASLYGAKQTFLSVNGSTLGILAGISACTVRGDTILIARNAHQSVYHAAYLRGLITEYILPEFMSPAICKALTLQDIQAAVDRHPHAALVVLVSPTYEGLHAQLPDIYSYLHKKGIKLLVDQAHGAHLGFHPFYPGSAAAYADLVVMSLHKTLPALTQTALIHVYGEAVQTDRLAHFISMYQTSSPSYVLLSSISQCLSFLKNNGQEYFDALERSLKLFEKKVQTLTHFTLMNLPVQKKDPGKLVLSWKKEGVFGQELSNLLIERFHIQPELCSRDYILCMATVGDTTSSIDRLYNALAQLDLEWCREKDNKRTASEKSVSDSAPGPFLLPVSLPQKKYDAFETEEMPFEWIPISDCADRICASFITLYPPGIPFVIPGECISAAMKEQLLLAVSLRYHIKGIKTADQPKIQVLQ